MPYSYSINDGIVRVVWEGMVTKDDLSSFGQAMPQVGRSLGYAPDVLHTFDEVTDHAFQPIAAYSYSLTLKRVRIPNRVRAAIVARTGEGQALAQVFKTLNRTANLEMEVFADEAAALAWIRAK